ncbi:MAG: regulator of sigma E protease [Candidatus Marinamargulisbacteria bacterium]|jgi:regulator of sigma E protease
MHGMGILITLLALGMVIFIHELGHMYVAKKVGVGVIEFSIGMGPRVFSKKWGETLYCFRVFPLGGFVKLAGLDDTTDEDESFPEEKHFQTKSVWKRSAIIVAGSVMNLVLGFLIFVTIYSLIGVPTVTPTIQKVLEGSPAANAGLISGDRILSVNNLTVEDTQKDMITTINDNLGKSLAFKYERSGQNFDVSIVPTAGEGKKVGLIGVVLVSETVRFGPIKAVGLSFQATGKYMGMVFKSLKMLVTGEASLKEMAGPIGIVQFASFELDRGFLNFLEIISMISISLGVINMFPFPVLDGGHLMFLMLEFFRKKPMNKKWEIIINNVGAACLIMVMILIVFNDIGLWKDRVVFLKTLTQ